MLIKITKKYTIKFSYGGVAQYADFNEVEGKIYQPSLMVSWANTNKIPDVSKCENIDEILSIIKSFAYGKQAEIYLINGMPPFYYEQPKIRDLINTIDNELQTFKEQKITIFFNVVLKPLLKKNKWKISRSHIGYLIVVEKNKNKEWDNITDTKKGFEFEYLCAKCLIALNLLDSIKLKNEQTTRIFTSHILLNIIDEVLINSEFYFEL